MPETLFSRTSHRYCIESRFKAFGRSVADETADPRPDMNIKVAAFTVSEKYINILNYQPEPDVHSKLQNICMLIPSAEIV